MGTSNSYSGPAGSNPLIPSWLDVPPEDDEQAVDPPEEDAQNPDRPLPVSSVAPDPNRFRAARSSFSKYIASGGENKQALGRAVSSYVSKSSGGAGSASARMGASRVAAGRLLSFLSDAQARGVAQALQALDLGSLVGRSATDVFFGLADYICPTEGTVDAGVARDAYAETLAEIAQAGLQSDALTAEQVGVFFESFMANTIFTRLCDDIGAGIVQFSKNPKEAAFIQTQIKDYIRGAVRDAVGSLLTDRRSIGKKEANGLTQKIYERAFSVLEAYGKKGTR